MLAREAAQRDGAFEALFCTDEGDVCEGTFSNVFAWRRGAVVTPGVERGCLPGIQRAHILAELAQLGVPVRVGAPRALRAGARGEVFLSNTTGRVIPVVEVRGLRSGIARVPPERSRRDCASA